MISALIPSAPLPASTGAPAGPARPGPRSAPPYGTARFLPGPCSHDWGGRRESASPFGVPGRRGFHQPGGVEEGGLPCVESGPSGLRALSQRCPGERKTDVALSRLGGRVARARATSSRLPVWPGYTRARLARVYLRHCCCQWPRPDSLHDLRVYQVPTCKACNGGPP